MINRKLLFPACALLLCSIISQAEAKLLMPADFTTEQTAAVELYYTTVKQKPPSSEAILKATQAVGIAFGFRVIPIEDSNGKLSAVELKPPESTTKQNRNYSLIKLIRFVQNESGFQVFMEPDLALLQDIGGSVDNTTMNLYHEDLFEFEETKDGNVFVKTILHPREIGAHEFHHWFIRNLLRKRICSIYHTRISAPRDTTLTLLTDKLYNKDFSVDEIPAYDISARLNVDRGTRIQTEIAKQTLKTSQLLTSSLEKIDPEQLGSRRPGIEGAKFFVNSNEDGIKEIELEYMQVPVGDRYFSGLKFKIYLQRDKAPGETVTAYFSSVELYSEFRKLHTQATFRWPWDKPSEIQLFNFARNLLLKRFRAIESIAHTHVESLSEKKLLYERYQSELDVSVKNELENKMRKIDSTLLTIAQRGDVELAAERADKALFKEKLQSNRSKDRALSAAIAPTCSEANKRSSVSYFRSPNASAKKPHTTKNPSRPASALAF